MRGCPASALLNQPDRVNLEAPLKVLRVLTSTTSSLPSNDILFLLAPLGRFWVCLGTLSVTSLTEMLSNSVKASVRLSWLRERKLRNVVVLVAVNVPVIVRVSPCESAKPNEPLLKSVAPFCPVPR